MAPSALIGSAIGSGGSALGGSEMFLQSWRAKLGCPSSADSVGNKEEMACDGYNWGHVMHSVT